MTITILKALSIIIVLAIMVLLLLSVNHLLRGDFDSKPSDLARLREDVDEDDHVITHESVFKELVKVHKISHPQSKQKVNS